jgi:hypothetical protein
VYFKRLNFYTIMNLYIFCIFDHVLTLWSFFYLYISLNLDEYDIPSSSCSSIDFFMHPSIINVVSSTFDFVLCPTLSMCFFHLIPFFILPGLMCLLHLIPFSVLLLLVCVLHLIPLFFLPMSVFFVHLIIN